MSGARTQALLWFAQRASAAVLALFVVVHLATLIGAVQGGLDAAEILARLRGNFAWLAFYGLFVLAASVHAPLGLRAVLAEHTALPAPLINVACLALALWLAIGGWQAALALHGGPA